MDPATEIAKVALRTQIKDNFRYICRTNGDPMVAVATHDKLYWIIVYATDASSFWNSGYGHETEEAALQSMSKTLSDVVWQEAKNRYITLSK
ncbi:hypothetical protein KCU93_g5978, partial [Aureobasidium melanogenum]